MREQSFANLHLLLIVYSSPRPRLILICCSQTTEVEEIKVTINQQQGGGRLRLNSQRFHKWRRRLLLIHSLTASINCRRCKHISFKLPRSSTTIHKPSLPSSQTRKPKECSSHQKHTINCCCCHVIYSCCYYLHLEND